MLKLKMLISYKYKNQFQLQAMLFENGTSERSFLCQLPSDVFFSAILWMSKLNIQHC